MVIPAFIAGVPGNLLAGIRANFSRASAPATITITFGEPLTFDEYRDAPASARTYLRIAEAMRRRSSGSGRSIASSARRVPFQ